MIKPFAVIVYISIPIDASNVKMGLRNESSMTSADPIRISGATIVRLKQLRMIADISKLVGDYKM